MSKWRPIDTAPKDGTYILVVGGKDSFGCKLKRPYIATSGFRLSPYGPKEQVWLIGDLKEDEEMIVAYPTHWMPLPESPKDNQYV